MGTRILVIGAGVSGITTAHVLTSRGYEATILADKDACDTPSVIAGALWEWQPAVCGHHRDEKSLERSKGWCVSAYRTFQDIATQPHSGVSMRRSNFYFFEPVDSCAKEREKKIELQPHVDAFRHDRAIIAENGVNPDMGLVDAYSHLAPVIETSIYMEYLRDELMRRGCRFVRRRLDGELGEISDDLLREFNASWIVNCAGLGARELAPDNMFPLRGALVRMINDGLSMPKVLDAHCISHNDDATGQNMVYLVPRGRDRLLLGGIAQPNEWDTDVDLDNCEAIRDIVARCRRFMPSLRSGRLDPTPVRVGLRPSRPSNVRLEMDEVHPIVHNYGHGGSGFSLSWGCAREVADLVGVRPHLYA